MTLRGRDGKFIPNPTPSRPAKRATKASNPVPLTQALASKALAAPKAPEPKPRKQVNQIAILLDASASMDRLEAKAREFANEQINQIKVSARESQQITYVTVMTFGESGREKFLSQNAYFESVAPVALYEYRANQGTTAIFDAIYKATNQLQAFEDKQAADRDVSYLVITLTDGLENGSRWTHTLPKEASDKNWSYVFLGPRGSKRELSMRGVPEGNIREWDQTEAALEQASVSTQSAIGNYYVARSAGATRTESFFTDLSNVKQKDLKKLRDVKAEFNVWRVNDQIDIKTFVESHKMPYSVGRGFYELMKPEKIQAHKEVVLMDKKTKAMYGGDEARKLLGIVGGAGVTVRVTPRNHAGYSVFVSSTSTNRILVRGTSFLYRK